MAKRKNNKRFKIKPSDWFTFAVAIVVLIVALFIYYYNDNGGINNGDGSNSDYQTSQTPITVSNDVMRIHFIDVGQGDCTFIQFPDGKNMLIDGGEDRYAQTVANYLSNLGVNTINILLATHQDADHIGCVDNIFSQFTVEYCFRPYVYYSGEYKDEFDSAFNVKATADNYKNSTTKTYYNFLKSVLDEGCNYSYFNRSSDFKQEILFNDQSYFYEVDFLTPTAKVENIGYSDANDYSPILTISYGGFTAMFTGDAGEEVEEELLNYYSEVPNVDLLKAGHHGSSTSSSVDFLQAVSPEYVLFSCGLNNEYGHPTKQTVDRVTSVAGALVYRTDMQGNIVFTVNCSGLSLPIATQKQVENYSQLLTPGN